MLSAVLKDGFQIKMLQRHGFSGEEIEKLVEIQERYLRFYEK